jgi:hypothetical protein
MATVPTIPFTLNTEQDSPTPVVKVQVPANIAAGQQIKITLVVADDLGNQSAPVTQTITVRQAPVATLSVPTVAAAGQTITLDASKSAPPANLKQFKWTIAEGPVTPPAPTPTPAESTGGNTATTDTSTAATTPTTGGKTKPA